MFRVDLFCSGKVDGEAVVRVQLNLTTLEDQVTLLSFRRRKMCYKSKNACTQLLYTAPVHSTCTQHLYTAPVHRTLYTHPAHTADKQPKCTSHGISTRRGPSN